MHRCGENSSRNRCGETIAPTTFSSHPTLGKPVFVVVLPGNANKQTPPSSWASWPSCKERSDLSMWISTFPQSHRWGGHPTMTKERVSNLEFYAQSTSTVISGQHQRKKGTTKVGKKKKECNLYKPYRIGQISAGYLCRLQRGRCLGVSGCLRVCDGFLGDRFRT